jgi:hypothetical protein
MLTLNTDFLPPEETVGDMMGHMLKSQFCDYMVVRCVPSARHVACMRRSQNKFIIIRALVTSVFRTALQIGAWRVTIGR